MAKEETRNTIEQLLREMDTIIDDDSIISPQIKVAYVYATQVLCNDYVRSRDIRVKFLRAELYNPRQAAIRYCKCLNVLWKEFPGHIALSGPLTIEDLSKDERQFLKSGGCQIFTNRERNMGRLVLFRYNYNHSNSNTENDNDGNNKKYCIITIQRRVELFLAWSVISEDVTSQINGLVMIDMVDSDPNKVYNHHCNRTETRAYNGDEGSITDEEILAAYPVRIVSVHGCYMVKSNDELETAKTITSNWLRPTSSSLKNEDGHATTSVPTNFNHIKRREWYKYFPALRIHSHVGSLRCIELGLIKFGIIAHVDFPMTPSRVLKMKNTAMLIRALHSSCDEQKKMHHNKMGPECCTNPTNTTWTIYPELNDITFHHVVRTMHFHPGNVLSRDAVYRKLGEIDEATEQLKNITNPSEAEAIELKVRVWKKELWVQEIQSELASSLNGKVLVYDKEKNLYFQCTSSSQLKSRFSGRIRDARTKFRNGLWGQKDHGSHLAAARHAVTVNRTAPAVPSFQNVEHTIVTSRSIASMDEQYFII